MKPADNMGAGRPDKLSHGCVCGEPGALGVVHRQDGPCYMAEPVAWGMPSVTGEILDVITPAEHDRFEGRYTVPLYAVPVHAPPQPSALAVRWRNLVRAIRGLP